MAELIEREGGFEGCYGAIGTDAEDGDSAALKLLKTIGVTPRWAWLDGRIVRPKPQIVRPSERKDSP
jgi:hypothetical protein